MPNKPTRNTIIIPIIIQMHKIQMPKLQMSMLVIHHRQLLISQFLKILLKDFGELMAMNLILAHWSMILDCVVRYGNMMLITEMKFEELTLKLIRTNLQSQTTRNLENKTIFVAFNLHGTIYFLHGLNILLRKMQPFVYPAFFLISHLGILHNVYSL
jgi:hypothetical protein